MLSSFIPQDRVKLHKLFSICSGKFKTGTTREVLEKRCTIEHCDKGHQHPSRWSNWIHPDPKDDNAILWKQKLRYCYIKDICILEEKSDVI